MLLSILAFAFVLVLVVVHDYWVRFGTRFNGDAGLAALQGQIFLTYDDGPASPAAAWGDNLARARQLREQILAMDPDWNFDVSTTANLARVLAAFDCRAVFFVRGDTLQADSAAHAQLRELLAAGHLLGNHAFSHTRYRELTVQQSLDEIAQTDRLLRDIGGSAPVLFRPPYGQWHVGRSLLMMQRTGTSGYALPILWTHATRDWQMTADDLAPEVLEAEVSKLLDELRACRSGIVLLQHDVWIYAVLFTRVLLERLRTEARLAIAEPAELQERALQTSKPARRWLALGYYLHWRLPMIKARLLAGRAPT